MDPGRLLADDVPQQGERVKAACLLVHAFIYLFQKMLRDEKVWLLAGEAGVITGRGAAKHCDHWKL